MTGCSDLDDGIEDGIAEEAFLVVYDKKENFIKPTSDEVVIFVQQAVGETKDGKLKKVDLLGETFDDDAFLDITGKIKYGKLGKKGAKNGDGEETWNKDANCPKKFNSKSITGRTTAGIGDTINYDIEVQNIGNVQLTEVVVTDTLFPVDCVNFNGILNPSQVVNCHVIWVVTADNVATACSRGGNIRNVAVVTSTQTNSFAADEFVGVACPR